MGKKSNDILHKMFIGVQRGASNAIAEHKLRGLPIVIWEDGKIVEIPPEKIVVPPYPDDTNLD